MKQNSIISLKPLAFMWPTTNPFLFCAHHLDNFPSGNNEMEPAASLKGRDLGQDFTIKDGWRMYHGETIPGFPVHPHRGFETVTIVLTGWVDHSDSHGQSGRYGQGDVQWMTAGAGLQHSEMFPLLNEGGENQLELFQVWMNLPKVKKFAEPYFKMLWTEDIPVYKTTDKSGKSAEIKVIAGSFWNVTALSPAPDSWAADLENEVAIGTIKMQPNASLLLSAANEQTARTLYFHKGTSIFIDDTEIISGQAIQVKSNIELKIVNGTLESELLLLQGKPIDEPVVQYGPFVMNSQSEIRQAITDYQNTEFGGWPWPRRDQVHPRTIGRFAKYSNGSEEIR